MCTRAFAESRASSTCAPCPSSSPSCGSVGSKQILDALLRRTVFPAAGTPVDCAVSGGADSLALLVLATEAGCDVTAVHVDHGSRTSSRDDAEVVAAAAARFGAGFVAHAVDVAIGPNQEARWREAR